MRRSIELDHRNLELARNFTYVERQETRFLDSTGRVKETSSRTTDIIWLEGSPYRRMVARDNKPLPPAEQRKEDEKLRLATAARHAEGPAQIQARLADWDRRQRHMHEPLSEVPDAFTFKLSGEETLNGREAYVIDATPKPGYKPRQAASAYLPHVKARLWIAKSDFQWLKAEAETLDTITFGGFLIRIAKGTHIDMEQSYVNKEAWILTKVSLHGSVRIALVKVIHGAIDFNWSGFQRVSAEPSVASTPRQER